MDYNEIMKQLAEYMRLAEETENIIDGLKDQLKNYMTAAKIDTLAGSEHKATYKPVTTNRIDTATLKKDLPDIAKRYTTAATTMRFSFS